MCSTNDDFGLCVCDSDLASRVAFIGQLSLEKLGQLGVEDTVSDDLSLLAVGRIAGVSPCSSTLVLCHDPIFMQGHQRSDRTVNLRDHSVGSHVC